MRLLKKKMGLTVVWETENAQVPPCEVGLMFNEILRGSLIAFVIWALSVFCLYNRLVPTYYFAAVLGAWFLYSAYRLFALTARRSATPAWIAQEKDAIDY